MKVSFVDGVVRECTPPTEQKLMKKTPDGELVPAGWVMTFHLIGVTDSSDIDRILTPENVQEMLFLSENDKTLFSLTGYSEVSSAAIRHAEDASATRAEIQFIKGGV